MTIDHLSQPLPVLAPLFQNIIYICSCTKGGLQISLLVHKNYPYPYKEFPPQLD